MGSVVGLANGLGKVDVTFAQAILETRDASRRVRGRQIWKARWKMTSVRELLMTIFAKEEVQLWIHHNELRFRDPAGQLTVPERELLTFGHSETIAELLSVPEQSTDAHNGGYLSRVPLTFQQEAALTHAEPGFFGIFCAHLRGVVNLDALSASVNELVQRHAALRTRVVVANGALLQSVEAHSSPGLEVADNGDPRAVFDNEFVHCYVNRLVNRWLESGTVTFAARLLRVSAENYLLTVLWDHLFLDYASQVLLFREMWSLYDAHILGEPYPLPQVPMQYGDYAIWQRAIYQKWSIDHGAYWEKKLSEISLPRVSQKIVTGRAVFSTIDISFGLTLSREMEITARRYRSSLAILVLGMYAALLARWSGQSQFVIPFYVSGRNYSRHVGLIGFFSHPVPLKIDLGGHETLLELLNVIGMEFVTSCERASIGKTPLGTPNPFRNPFMQWFNSSPIPGDAMIPESVNPGSGRGDLRVEPLAVTWEPAVEPSMVESPLALHLWNSPEGVRGVGRYRVDLFGRERMMRFVQELIARTEGMIRNPVGRPSNSPRTTEDNL